MDGAQVVNVYGTYHKPLLFAQLAKRYRFSEKEIQAAPLIFKNLLLGAYYYGGATDFAKGDEKRLSDFLDYLAKQLTESELDFPAILQK